MITRTYKALTSRPVFVLAAALAILMLAAPFAFAETSKLKYPENGKDSVATFSASDADADAGAIDEWSLGGEDAEDFEISDDGELSFKKSPDFEKPSDRDEDPGAAGDQGLKDNKYQVTVKVSGGSQAVEVEVTNVDEDWQCEFRPAPAAGYSGPEGLLG